MSGPSDEALLAGLGAGDSEAAAAFVRRFQRRVFGLAMTVLGDAEAAEEVAQDTLVRAWRYAHTFDPRKGRVDMWLLTIARNAAIEALRLMPRPASHTGLDALLPHVRHPISDYPGEPDAVVMSHELRAAVRRLPREQSRALFLAVVFGYTANEIAESEGVPLGTAKTRVRSALLKLRALLEVDHG